MRRTVLVTDGEQRAALSIVRSLGRAGYRCVVGSADGLSLAGASRFAHSDVRLPNAAADPEAYTAAVADQVRRTGAELLIPVAEPALLALLAKRDQVPARMPFPDLETFQAICDKERVLRTAAKLGIAVPRQFELRSAGAEFPKDLDWPVVLKPARSVATAADGTRVKVGVRWASTSGELRSGLAEYPESAFPILVQETIAGPGIGIFVLLHQGNVLASFAHRRLREKPPRGGVSVLRQSEPMDEELLRHSVALLQAFDWCGVAMVEYKRQQATGRPYLMEINGRFWGSLQLAVDAGVDFPVLLASACFGEPVSPVTQYRSVRSRWLLGDVDNLIAQLREPGQAWGTRFTALVAWLTAFAPGNSEEILRWTDPRPFLRESALWLKQLAST